MLKKFDYKLEAWKALNLLLKVDFGYQNFLMFQDELFWYDPFVSKPVHEVIWLSRYPS